jgi:hypothetical protein
VVIPVVVPFRITLAKAIGSLVSASVTLPLIVNWAQRVVEKKKKTATKRARRIEGILTENGNQAQDKIKPTLVGSVPM